MLSLPSPLSEYRAFLQHRFLTAPPPDAVPPDKLPAVTPEASRGRFTMVDQGDLRIEVELGPLLEHHLFRGTCRALQVSVWA